jgi:hypothetical protein
MKRTLFALIGMTVMGAGLASAQVSTPLRFTMDRPFHVENQLLPAGTYLVEHMTYNINALRISPLAGDRGAFTFTSLKTNAVTPAASEVVFNQYGDELFLNSIVVEGRQFAAESLASRSETTAAKSLGSPVQTAVRAVLVRGRG